MSLATAPKDISEHPKAGSVVDPVNKKEMQADVDRKLRFYGIINAFRQGKMPSNAQIDETLAYVVGHSPIPEKDLSADGRKLIQDVRDIVETSRMMVTEKNSDELIQNFVWHTQDVELSHAKKDPNEILPVSSDKAKADGQEAVRHLRTILSLVLTNSEVRKLLSDFQIIGRDLLARGAANAAGAIAPSDEQKAQVDAAAPYDQFHSANGKIVGSHETPVLEANIGGSTIRQHPKDDLGTGATVIHNGEEMSGQEVYNRGQAKVEEVQTQMQGQGQDQAEEVKSEATAHLQEVVDENGQGPETEQKKQTVLGKIKNISNRIPQEHKDLARQQTETARKFLQDEFPEERRDQFIYRGKKVVIECQKHDDYKESMTWLIGLVEEYASHAGQVRSHTVDIHEKVIGDSKVQLATRELRTLLERFANNQSIDPILEAFGKLAEDAKTDEELKGWFNKLDAYIRKILLQEGFVLEPACDSQGRELRDSGRYFFEKKYKEHFDGLFNTIGVWFRAMGDDPLNKRFGEDWSRLTRDLLFDSEGSLKFKPHLWTDIQKVILPTIVNQVGYLPIPRIEYTDDQMDLVIENLTLSGRNLFPNAISVEAHNFLKFSPYSAIKNESHHEFTFTFAQMQADMRDVAFYFKKKSGFPKLSDSGLADVVLGGSGLTATVHLISADKDRSSVFKVKNVVVKVDSLKFSIRDSKHDLLYKTLAPLATGIVKKQIQKAIRDSITTAFEYVDGQLVIVRDRMDEASKSDETTRTQVLKELFAKKQESANSVTDSAKARSAQFKVSVNKRDSLLATAGHPAGWVNRAAEKDNAATAGEDWKSPVFHIID